MLLGKFRMRVVGVLMATAIMGFGAPSAGLAETLKIGGTGGDLGTMRQLGEAFTAKHPGVTVEVLPSLGSGGGVEITSQEERCTEVVLWLALAAEARGDSA